MARASRGDRAELARQPVGLRLLDRNSLHWDVGPFDIGDRKSPRPNESPDALLVRALAVKDGQLVTMQDLGDLTLGNPHQLKGLLPAPLRDRIQNRPGQGYVLTLNLSLEDGGADYTDIADFRATVERFADLAYQPYDRIDSTKAEEALNELTRVLGLWQINPVQPLLARQSDQRYQGLHLVQQEWDRLKEVADRALNVCRVALASSRIECIGLAVDAAQGLRGYLPDEGDAIRQEHAVMDWYTLMGAYIASGRPVAAVQLYDRLARYYADVKVRPPETLTALRDSIRDVEAPQDGELLKLMFELGITHASAMNLRQARMEPADCIARTDRRLSFSGVLSSKWVDRADTRVAFEDLLRRLDRHLPDAGARFLIVHPLGDAYRRLKDLRQGKIRNSSVRTLARLVRQHPSFEVRVFDSLPAFRIIIIDDQVVTFSAYHLDNESYNRADSGWSAPHIVCDPKAKWPIAHAFTQLFEESWQAATDLEQLDLDGLDEDLM